MLKFGLFLVSCSAVALVFGCGSSTNSADPGPTPPPANIRIEKLVNQSLGSAMLLKELPEGVFLIKSVKRTMSLPAGSNSFEHVILIPGLIKEGDKITTANHSGTSEFSFSTGFPQEVHSTQTELRFIDGRSFWAGSYLDLEWSWELGEKGGSTYCDDLRTILEEAVANEEKVYKSKSDSCGVEVYNTVFQMLDDRIYITVHQIQKNTDLGDSFTQFEFIKGVSIEAIPVSKTFKK